MHQLLSSSNPVLVPLLVRTRLIGLAQTWAWTALGKLNIIMVMPDPRVRSVPNLEWWALYNKKIVKFLDESVTVGDV
jgi:hypothetical protein